MGYKRKRKTINIAFEEGHPFAGLEVRLRGLSLGEYLDLIGMGEVDRSAVSDGLKMMSAALLSWNLEDEETGEAVPATAEAVYAEDQEMMLAVMNAWIDALRGGVRQGSPLPESSPAGEPSPAVSIPMEPLSGSLAS
ncbi:hypothetical protein D7231_31795 [Streptomyces klenkii]|uniref:Uncharacterized protein n=1 Tax=Streptomyces klenkii TaxID=1420899 RepID=A0A3B0AMG3_9ACTN|nr:hypothetical protein [Streptomyces klenkii]RKN61858.1 hypothetical protein D7231_31795 [Streptomyces klenkii]